MRKVIIGVLISVFLSSCATYKADFKPPRQADGSKGDRQWSKSKPAETQKIQHSIYLVGDAGNTLETNEEVLLFHLEKVLKKANNNSSIIFLGDNIYPAGMPPKKNKAARADAEQKMMSQLNILEDFPGQVFMTPGNHDWRNGGIKAVKREEKFVEKQLNRGNVFLPDNACGDPEWVDLSEGLGMIVIDSEWWLANWDKEPDINNGCGAKTRSEMMATYYSLLKKNRDKVIIIAFHHPLFTNGYHGGFFDAKTHIFPLTQFSHNAWIPLPGLGTLYAFLRKNVGVREDLHGSRYTEFKKAILSTSNGFNNLIFVAGHEHTLQHHEAEGHHFIVSGAGAKSSPVRNSGAARFTYGRQGFVRVDVYEDQSAWAHFYGLKENKLQEIYRVQVQQPTVESASVSYTEFFEKKDSTVATIYSGNKKTGLNRLLWGELHRDLYYQPVKVPTLNLETVNGGLTPTRKGGGLQTNSLRLEDNQGREYVLRALQKDAGRLMGGILRETVIPEIMKDVFTFTHPYAAYAIPRMAEAVGIYHTNPKLVYMPKQPKLGGYNDNFGGELYLFEKRISGGHNTAQHFGNSDKLISSYELIYKHKKNNHHRVDEGFLIRNRLFDMIIGDWDRHQDQWRWARFDQEDGTKLYRPIPRDRDQAFSKFDGIAFDIVKYMVPPVKQFQTFDYEIKKMDWYFNNVKEFDRFFLSASEWPIWEAQIKDIQAGLTDAIIKASIHEFPPLVFEATGEDIIAKLKSRRDKLPKMARQLYEWIAREADVLGTEKDDIFEVQRIDSKTTVVSVFDKKKQQRYKRTFHSNETNEIRLWGLGGDDTFYISGEVKKGILIRIVGGQGDDNVTDKSKVSGLSKKTKVYDSPAGLTFNASSELKDHRTSIHSVNEFEYKKMNSNFQNILPSISYDNEDGLSLGLSYKAFRYEFKKEPYKQLHQFNTSYTFGTKGINFDYQGEFNQVLGKNDLLIKAYWQSPLYILNYFGAGNESESTIDDLAFNKVRQAKLGGALSLRRRRSENAHFGLSLLFDEISIEKTAGRFVSLEEANLPASIFTEQYYAGPEVNFHYKNKDDELFPNQGFVFDMKVGWQANFKDIDENFVSINISVTSYNRLFDNKHFVYATKIGFQHVEGETTFYQNPRLGGNLSLRGYRNDRFNGNTAFYQNSDLRITFGKVKTRLFPLTVGTNISFDHGRVWLKEEDSDVWHYTYGGDFWVNILDLAIIRGGVHWSTESHRVSAGMRFAF